MINIIKTFLIFKEIFLSNKIWQDDLILIFDSTFITLFFVFVKFVFQSRNEDPHELVNN